MENPKKEVASKPYGVVLLLWIFLKSRGYLLEIGNNESQKIFYSMKYEKLSSKKGTYSEIFFYFLACFEKHFPPTKYYILAT